MAAGKIGIIGSGNVGIPSAERMLDQAIELTFPASDPIAVDHAFRSARRRDRARAADNASPPQSRRTKPKRRRS